jgi:hypothetical protein
MVNTTRNYGSLGFVHRSFAKKIEKTTFLKLRLFPSSEVDMHLLFFPPTKE